jgi:hypothetical protein
LAGGRRPIWASLTTASTADEASMQGNVSTGGNGPSEQPEMW